MTDAVQRISRHISAAGGAAWLRAPGRVNLIGDHTNHNDGSVLPVAIDREYVVAARRADVVRVISLDLGDAVELPPDSFLADVRGAFGDRDGDRVEVSVDVRRLHFFDPATENAIGA